MFNTVLLATGCTDQSDDLTAHDEPANDTTPERRLISERTRLALAAKKAQRRGVRTYAALAAVAVAGLVAAGEARAAEALYDGNKLLGYCESRDLAEQGLCAGFVAGAADTLAYATERGANIGGRRTCYPVGITVQHARDVIMRALWSKSRTASLFRRLTRSAGARDGVPMPVSTNDDAFHIFVCST